jgi:hypothetical protein
MGTGPNSEGPNAGQPSSDGGDTELQIALLQELGSSLRFRSEAEHLYTAAAVGSFGAVAWGVAALVPANYLSRPFYLRPAFVAAIGILIVAALIVRKIVTEHGIYAQARAEQARIASLLESRRGSAGLIPAFMLKPEAGPGYKGSRNIVVCSAVAAAGFCLLLVWR